MSPIAVVPSGRNPTGACQDQTKELLSIDIKKHSFFLLSLQLVCIVPSGCPIFTSCLLAGWVLHCLNDPVLCCHSLSRHTDPDWKKRREPL